MLRHCIVLVDRARARLLVSETPEDDLKEVGSLVNPRQRMLESEAQSETRPGIRQSSKHGPSHGVDDHRFDNRDEDAKRFVEEILQEIADTTNNLGVCKLVVCASESMLGLIRPALKKTPLENVKELEDMPLDITKLSVPEIHQAMIKHDVLPEREPLHWRQ